MISTSLRILLVLVAASLAVVTLRLVRNGRLPVRYSLPWLLASFILLLVGAVPEWIGIFTMLVGFETTSNLVIGIILAILLAMSLILTVIVSKQHKTIVVLVQELSLLRKSVDDMRGGTEG